MKTKSLIVLTAVAAMFLTACQERPYINNPGEMVDQLPDSVPVPQPSPDPEGFEIPEGTINVLDAVQIGQNLESGATTEKEYYIKGWVRNFDEKERAKADFEEKFAQYGNDYVHLSARQDGAGSKTFYCYRILGKGGKKLPNHDVLQIGDFIVVKCKIQNYKGTIESSGTCSTELSTNPLFEEAYTEDPTKITPDPDGANVPEGTLTVHQARAISDSIGSGKSTTEEYYVKGWISKLHKDNASGITGNYHNATFYITPTNDGTTSGIDFEAYRVKGPNKGDITDVNQVQVGDFVVLRCKIKNYNGTAENDNGGYIYYSSNPLLQ